MTSSTAEEQRHRRGMTIVVVYPVVVVLISLALNWFVLGVNAYAVALPSVWCVRALVIAGILVVLNHTWLMTATELTRGRFRMRTTPEEWAASGSRPEDAPREGVREVERHHNAHRNATENTVHFGLLAFAFVLASPSTAAALAWLVGFGVARLGYTYSYLAGRDDARGGFMTLSLLTMYGMASYLVLSLF